MKTIVYTITDELGIHARPAGLLARQAQQFKSEMTMKKGDKDADLRKIFAVMGLNVKKDNVIEIDISGPDEGAAADAIGSFLEANL